jgi:hypothetical protein
LGTHDAFRDRDAFDTRAADFSVDVAGVLEPSGHGGQKTMNFHSLITLVESHAADLTRDLVADVSSNPRTTFLHNLSRDELQKAATTVYTNLGRWLAESDEAEIEREFAAVAKRRHAEGVPASELVYAMILVKQHLLEYVNRNQLVDAIVDLYQREGVELLIGQFFDKAIYHTLKGYETYEKRWEDPKLAR